MDDSVASPDSADGCRSTFSEPLEFSTDNCELCSSAASERESKMTQAALRHVTGESRWAGSKNTQNSEVL